jgi:hypothetical protein
MTTYSNRYKEFVKGVKLPSVYTPEDRGYEKCCCKLLVWGSEENDPWKQMKEPAWIRDVDAWRFYLVKESTGEEIEIEAFTPILEPSARYCSVDWSVILFDYGSGCYTLKIDYEISSIEGTMVWGEYTLIPFSLHVARKYVQFRTVINSLMTEPNINLRGSNVVTSINFEGIFGEANPNTQISNLIYANREAKKSYRENLYEYEVSSKPLSECVTKRLLDVHLLHENEIYISDFNPNNHTQYLDKACIVEKVDKPTYVLPFAKIKATFGDKIKNSRSRYGI